MKTNHFLDLKSFFQQKNEVRSIGGDFFVCEYRKGAIASYPIKSDMYVCSIGLQGYSKGQVNLLPFELVPQSLCITFPEYILEQGDISDDFRCLCIAISENFLSGLGLTYDFKTFLTIQDKPILKLTEKQFASVFKYYDMVYSVLGSTNPYKKEIVKHLTCAFFYGLGHYFFENNSNRELTNEEKLMQQFIKEVQLHYKQERKVLFYAERLHLSVGYLSTIVKKVSKRTATEWIDDYVILEAKALLKSRRMTIQQVSWELNFPSQSFFGKYFKRHTGVSPKEYKEKY